MLSVTHLSAWCGPSQQAFSFSGAAVTLLRRLRHAVLVLTSGGTPRETECPHDPRDLRTASLTFARSCRSFGGRAITASCISAGNVSGLWGGFSAHSTPERKPPWESSFGEPPHRYCAATSPISTSNKHFT